MTVTCTAGPVNGECFKTQTFFYYAEDLCGNGVTETVDYSWKDDEVPPTISGLPAVGRAGQQAWRDRGSNPSAAVCEECDGTVTVTCTAGPVNRSEESRVGKECESRCLRDH